MMTVMNVAKILKSKMVISRHEDDNDVLCISFPFLNYSWITVKCKTDSHVISSFEKRESNSLYIYSTYTVLDEFASPKWKSVESLEYAS